MTEESVDFLIIGGGVAGYACARTLCDSGAAGSIALVTRDPDPPYDRTAGTKGYLRGSISHDEALLAPPEWWQQQQVALNTRTSVLKLDAAAKTVTLSDKRTLRFGQALLS